MRNDHVLNQELPNLDLLRSAAVLSVFFAHLYGVVTHRISEVAWHFGQIGVLIFFVHTSLVLMQSLDRLGLEGRSLYSTFYVRRWFRIYPLSMFCVICTYVFGFAPEIDEIARRWSAKELFANLSLTQNLLYSDSMVGGLWTLPLEVQMYVALPILFLAFRNRPIKWLVALWAVTIPLALIQPHISGRLNVVEYTPCFIAGIIAWRISATYFPKLPGWLWPLALAAICPIWMSATRQSNMYYRWAFCLALGCTIPWFRQITWSWLTAPAKLVARYSYGIYLSHIAIMVLCFREFGWQNRIGLWATFIALAVGIPIAMYHLLEHPMVVMARKLTSRSSARPLLIEPAIQPKVL